MVPIALLHQEGAASAFWQSTLDSLSDSVALLDQEGTIVAVNRPWREFAEANGGGEGVGIGVNYLSVCAQSAASDPVADEVGLALAGVLAGERGEYERLYPCHAPDRERWFSMRLAAFAGEGPCRAIVTHHDSTERYLALRHSEERAALLNAVGAAIVAIDVEGVITHWSEGAEQLYGWPASAVLGLNATEVLAPPDMLATAVEGLRRLPTWNGPLSGEFQVCRSDGSRVCVAVRAQILREEGGLVGFIGVSLDVTERREMESQLRRARDFLLAVTDTMPDGLIVADHEGRITLANHATERMLGWSEQDLLGRCKHDTLHALRPDGTLLPDEECPVTIARKAGVSIRVDDDVFQRRDGTFMPVAYSAAPFVTDAGSTGSVVVFGDITELKAREIEVRRELDALSWVGRIRDALEQHRFTLYAQPIVDIETGVVVQHELLVRMLGARGEVIAPDLFLPVAEEHGLIGAIDREVFEMALDYPAAGHAVEINISADSISDPRHFRFVKERLEARGVDPRLVGFEITETALIRNEAVAQTFIENVRELDCAVALDDFGTGYGSFRYLKRLPVTMLKIDQEFIRDLDTKARAVNCHVIEAIVTLARGMGQTTVAEGVESETVLELLRDLGVNYAQGYYFARPAPADAVLSAIHQEA